MHSSKKVPQPPSGKRNGYFLILSTLLLFFMISGSTHAGRWIKAYGAHISGEDYQEAWGVDPGFFDSYFMENQQMKVQMVSNNIPGNILWPGDKQELTLQLTNLTVKPVKEEAQVRVIQYTTFTYPDFVAHLGVKKIKDIGSKSTAIDVPAGGYQNITVHPDIPAEYGGYAVFIDVPGQARLFANACIRTLKTPISRRKFHQLTMDMHEIPALVRLGAPPNRTSGKYYLTTTDEYEEYYEELSAHMEELDEANLVTTVEFSASGRPNTQPLGRTRPWLDENNVMQRGKRDYAWMPEYDEDFQKFVYRLISDYGWPKGPINGVMLWNEPWEGTSISGWQADMIRYRSIYKHMALGTHQANQDENLDVWVGGCDSYSNTMDKLFPDGTDEMLPWLDFMSLHYTGLNSYSTIKKFNNRRGPAGNLKPVAVWDTESWIANSDERVTGVLSAMLAAGYQRVVGVMGRGVVTSTQRHRIQTEDGNQRKEVTYTWSTGASVGAFSHFVGNREFERLLFKNGLPWIMVFRGLENEAGIADEEDKTVVVAGDLGQLFDQNTIPFRSVRSLDEVRYEDSLRKVLAGLPEDAREQRKDIQGLIDAYDPYSGASLTIDATSNNFNMYDIYGNKVEPEMGRFVIPLNQKGFYFKGDGQTGSHRSLINALRRAEIKGLEPLATKCKDMTLPVDNRPSIEIELTNILNRKIHGALSINLEGLDISYPRSLTFKPHQTKTIQVKVNSGEPTEDNTYRLSLTYQGDNAGKAIHQEDLHVNWISRKHITVDGDLQDWEGALPQTIIQEGTNAPSLTEYVRRPFLEYDRSMTQGVSTAYLAYDKHYFYFAAKIADESKDDGMPRFNERDDNQYFYPDTAYVEEDGELKPLIWPEGVRHYSYRKNFTLPSGENPNKDNVLIGFDAITHENEPWYPHPEGIMYGFSNFRDTDYEFALNKVSEEYGGGHEIWTMQTPGMPDKHFYPRQPKSPLDGPVKDGLLTVQYKGNTRVVECAIPWSAIPQVKQRLDNNEPVKFTYRVNDNSGVGTMELAKGRSTSFINSVTFHDHWKEHWSNSLEFGWEKW